MSATSLPLLAFGSSKHTLRRLFVFLCLVAWPGAAWAQPTSIRFRHLSAEDGLSQGTVHCILQDRRGFMWFGTEDGLNRFDGYEFEVFRHDDLDVSSLAHSYVESIVEDTDGGIWVGTPNGLDRWSSRSETFEHFKHDPNDDASLSQDRITVVLMDPGGTIWVGTESGGLNRFSPEERTFVRYTNDPDTPQSLSSDRISALARSRDRGLWVGTRDGLDYLDPSTGAVTHFVGGPGQSDAFEGYEISTILETDDGSVWIGTQGGGLYRLDPRERQLKRFEHDAGDEWSLASDHVAALYMHSPDTIWIATSRGLDELRLDSERFHHHRSDINEPTSVLDNEVRSLYRDRGSVLWVGTGKGLSRWNTRTNAFGYVNASSVGLSSNTITSFALQGDHTLWVGTFGGGLNRVDRRTGALMRYQHDPTDPRSLSDDRAMTLLVDRDERVWVGTYSGGLNLFDGADGFDAFRHDPDDPNSLSRNGIAALHENATGGLWVGTFEGGLNHFDPATRRFRQYRASPVDPMSLSDDRVQSLYQDSEGILWVGTDGGGLNRLDPDSGRFTAFRHRSSEPATLGSDSIYSIAEDAYGTMWIGTEQGLNEWRAADRRAQRPRFDKYTSRHGLPNDVIYGVVPDGRGSLWLSTNRGLSRLDLETRNFENFGPAHGLQGNEFNFGAYHASGAGELFFGGVNGYNHFFPERIDSRRTPPPVVLTSFLKLNEAVELSPPITESDAVQIGYRDYVITFEFAALDYTDPEQNRYAYKLEGFNADWIELGTVRRATYTNLDAGDYVLRVKASNNDGVWNEAGAELRVSVLPAPWETWWAYALYALIAGGLLATLAGAQSRKLRREAEHARALEEQVRDRTQELAERNDELITANDRLEQAAVTDSLTGLLNRRYLTTHISSEIAAVTRHYVKRMLTRGTTATDEASHDLVFLMTDLDGLKKINDEHGHLAGDQAIIQMCTLLKQTCRASDTLIRWGGDEFMIVGRGLTREGAEILSQRIRDAVTGHTFDIAEGVRLHLSCSIGFAFFPFSRKVPQLLTGDHVISIADQALYIAKRSGRNSWVGIYESESRALSDGSRLLDGDLEQLAEEGVIELVTSLDNEHDLVLEGR